MKKYILMLLCVLLLLSACAPGDTALEDPFPVSPVAEAGSGTTRSVTLYFGYRDEDMLGTETRDIEMPLDERPETFIIRQLLQGPLVAYADLRGLFNSDVEIVSVESSGRLLILTLSRAFLDAPMEGANNPAQAGQMEARNRLALYSIVNTVTELGEYDRVQLQVQSTEENGGGAQRLKKSDFLLGSSEEDDSLLGPIGREYDYILSPRRAVDIALDAWTKRDWGGLYGYLAAEDSLPSSDAVATALANAPVTLIHHQVLDTTVSDNGQSATVALDLEYMQSGATSNTRRNTIIKLARENEAWKILYSSIELLSQLPG